MLEERRSAEESGFGLRRKRVYEVRSSASDPVVTWIENRAGDLTVALPQRERGCAWSWGETPKVSHIRVRPERGQSAVALHLLRGWLCWIFLPSLGSLGMGVVL